MMLLTQKTKGHIYRQHLVQGQTSTISTKYHTVQKILYHYRYISNVALHEEINYFFIVKVLQYRYSSAQSVTNIGFEVTTKWVTAKMAILFIDK